MSSDGRVVIGASSSGTEELRVISDNPVGIYTKAEGSGNIRRGVNAVSSGGNSSAGLYGSGSTAALQNYGVQAFGSGGDTSYGIYASGSSALTNYAGYFSGDVAYTGSLIPVSDVKLKENVASLDGPGILAKLMQMRPRSYSFSRSSEYAPMSLPAGKHFGLIAQEVEEIFPELVSSNTHPGVVGEDGQGSSTPIDYKGVDYMEMIPLLIQAIQEQQAEIVRIKNALHERGINVGSSE